jgi:LmbE family N-acetylglucosaminyl deacetylase
MQCPQFLGYIFERTATRFLGRVHRITHRMPAKLRNIEKQRVLVIAPHPDDEVIAIGGCLALHQRAGSTVTTIYVTLDEPLPSGEIPREGEADKASKLLGFDYRFLKFPDGRVSLHEPALARQIGDAVRNLRPDVVFCPFPGDHHRDHQAVAAATAAAVKESRFGGEIWCYEVWSNLWPNVVVDISSVVEEKRAAINCYQSVVVHMPYGEAVLGLNRFRGFKMRIPFGEALYVCSGKAFIDLCRTLTVV